jgi:hypothetical protein
VMKVTPLATRKPATWKPKMNYPQEINITMVIVEIVSKFPLNQINAASVNYNITNIYIIENQFRILLPKSRILSLIVKKATTTLMKNTKNSYTFVHRRIPIFRRYPSNWRKAGIHRYQYSVKQLIKMKIRWKRGLEKT